MSRAVSADVVARTARLVLRRMRADDVERIFELDSDPQVRRYVHAGAPDRTRIREVVLPRMLSFYERSGAVGFWAIEDRNDGAFLGWICLRPEETPRQDAELEIGFRLRRDAWGRGLATEASRALLERAVGEGRATRFAALVIAENRASCRVLEKLGFSPTSELVMVPAGDGSPSGEPEQALRYLLDAS